MYRDYSATDILIKFTTKNKKMIVDPNSGKWCPAEEVRRAEEEDDLPSLLRSSRVPLPAPRQDPRRFCLRLVQQGCAQQVASYTRALSPAQQVRLLRGGVLTG